MISFICQCGIAYYTQIPCYWHVWLLWLHSLFIFTENITELYTNSLSGTGSGTTMGFESSYRWIC